MQGSQLMYVYTHTLKPSLTATCTSQYEVMNSIIMYLQTSILKNFQKWPQDFILHNAV